MDEKELKYRTAAMRLNHVLYRFKQVARENKENAMSAGKFTKIRFEYCAAQIEETLKMLHRELESIHYLDVE